jgi:hypothetical protein
MPDHTQEKIEGEFHYAKVRSIAHGLALEIYRNDGEFYSELPIDRIDGHTPQMILDVLDGHARHFIAQGEAQALERVQKCLDQWSQMTEDPDPAGWLLAADYFVETLEVATGLTAAPSEKEDGE